MTTKLIHYSDKPLKKLRSMEQEKPQTAADKPKGLWFSVGADWKRTCKANRWKWAKLDVATDLKLKRGAKILRLECSIQMYEFTEKYGVECPFASKHPMPFLEPVIDWRRVAKEYQGIIIAPYLHECRNDTLTFWYYTWDCASGCIWDMDAVVSPLRETVDTK